jgi:hypothetical protein
MKATPAGSGARWLHLVRSRMWRLPPSHSRFPSPSPRGWQRAVGSERLAAGGFYGDPESAFGILWFSGQRPITSAGSTPRAAVGLLVGADADAPDQPHIACALQIMKALSLSYSGPS